eukprot:EG_transcript_55319
MASIAGVHAAVWGNRHRLFHVSALLASPLFPATADHPLGRRLDGLAAPGAPAPTLVEVDRGLLREFCAAIGDQCVATLRGIADPDSASSAQQLLALADTVAAVQPHMEALLAGVGDAAEL